MLTLFRVFLIYVLTSFIHLISHAYQDDIIAYVNDDVITSYDLENRIGLTESINKTKISDSAKKQILQMLIDEKLLFQIAKRNDIVVPKQQIKLYANEVAKDSGFASLNQFIAHHKINQNELMKQVEAQLLLRKFIEIQIGPDTKVSKQEVIDNMKIISQSVAYETKVKIYEIVFYKEKINQNTMSEFVHNVYSQLQKGDSFENIAKQFSQSDSASDGGLIGFVKLNQLSKPIVDALEGKLKKFEAGYVTHPVETDNSIMIIKLADTKKDKVNQKQLSEEEVENILYNKKLAINIKKFINNLRQTSYINIK